MLNIAVIHGTKRPGNFSGRAAQYLLERLATFSDVEVNFVDPSLPEFAVIDEDTTIPKFHEIVEAADAFIIVSPEYNHAFPGTLKSLLDTEFAAYAYKPAIIAGVSDGFLGGARMAEALTGVLRTLKIFTLKNDIYFAKIPELFDENGPTDPELQGRVDAALIELIKVGKALKEVRPKLLAK